MNLQQIRDFVRLTLDVDDEELPDTILNIFIQEGANKCQRASQAYSFYGVEYNLLTIANQQAYVVFNPTSNASGITRPLRSIESVRSTNFALRPVSHVAARRYFRSSQAATTNPYRWSIWGESIYLWPKPSAGVTLSIQGYRQPSDWIATGAGGVPDMPEEFHEVIAYWALHRGYLQQDDIEMAQVFASTFDSSLKAAASPYIRGNSAGPFIMSGGMGAGEGSTSGLGPIYWPFD